MKIRYVYTVTREMKIAGTLAEEKEKFLGIKDEQALQVYRNGSWEKVA